MRRNAWLPVSHLSRRAPTSASRRQGSTGSLFDWIAAEVRWVVEIVAHSPRGDFQVAPDGPFQHVVLSAVFEPLPGR